ncbi:MAG TPA: site-specific integrase [Gemmatimonadaceae bacterium]|nr:site-specific integrase [Gemmatimonadaceae bacterium]
MLRVDAAYWQWTEAQWIQAGLARIRPCRPRPSTREHAKRQMGVSTVYAVGYVLCQSNAWARCGLVIPTAILARRIFGADFDESLDRVVKVLKTMGYSFASEHEGRLQQRYPEAPRAVQRITPPLARVLLWNRSPRLEHLTYERLLEIRDEDEEIARAAHKSYVALSKALVTLGIIKEPFRQRKWGSIARFTPALQEGVAHRWVHWVERWFSTSTLAPTTRQCYRSVLYSVGRWLGAHHPDQVDPERWTTELAAAFTAAIDRAHCGDWSVHTGSLAPGQCGQPFKPRTKAAYIRVVRTFFRDLVRWKWVALTDLDPREDFKVPTSIVRLIGPKPRDVAQAHWIKLVWASLNLTDDDITACTIHPPSMVRAMAVLWTHAGLRTDELIRLAVGCVHDVPAAGASDDPIDAELAALVCFLRLPVAKTATERTKPVGRAVAAVVRDWEAVRPPQRPALDRKTNELVYFLFSTREDRAGKDFVNRTLIPLLCRKAGMPIEDVPGKRITSHRGRASAASWYFNTQQGMTLEELRQWLGHRQLSSTEHYVQPTPIKQARAFARAHKNSGLIELLIDTEAVTSGAAASGTPWQYYDLGHGYCSNELYAYCPHRMMCPACEYHVPYESDLGRILRAKGRAQRMLIEMPLSAAERAALAGDVAVRERLAAKLLHTPTPSGQTPAELTDQRARRALPVLDTKTVRVSG